MGGAGFRGLMALVTTTEMFKKAYDGGYAVGAFNVNNMEIVQGITEAAGELESPVILQVSKGARAYANHTYLVKMVEAAVLENPQIPIALHLDHGDTFELCKSCIDGGFTSVMIDASSKSFEDNIALTKQVVEYAHDHGVVVEAELGTLAGIEDEVQVESGKEAYTRPEEVEEFVDRTGCDSLAIAIGTSHGAYKFTAAQCTRNADGILVPPPLRFDVLEECIKRLPGFPIVLHGSSSVPQEFVKMVNQYGGNMPDAVGIPEEQLRKAAKLAVCKINIDSDIRLAMTGNIRKYFAEHPDHFDPRQYLKPARQAVKDMVAHKIVNVLGSCMKTSPRLPRKKALRLLQPSSVWLVLSRSIMRSVTVHFFTMLRLRKYSPRAKLRYGSAATADTSLSEPRLPRFAPYALIPRATSK